MKNENKKSKDKLLNKVLFFREIRVCGYYEGLRLDKNDLRLN